MDKIRKDKRPGPLTVFTQVAVVALLLAVLWMDGDCASPVRLWILVQALILFVFLILLILNTIDFLYAKFETFVKLGKMIFIVFDAIWIFIGWRWIYNDSACYSSYFYGYLAVCVFVLLLVLPILFSLILLGVLLIPEIFKQSKNKAT